MVIRWTWRFAIAKPPYEMLLFSLVFYIDTGIFYADTRRNFVTGGCYFFTVNLLDGRTADKYTARPYAG